MTDTYHVLIVTVTLSTLLCKYYCSQFCKYSCSAIAAVITAISCDSAAAASLYFRTHLTLLNHMLLLCHNMLCVCMQTGTLTTNQMTVVALVTPQEALQLDGSSKLVAAECAVSGVSYEPVGTITGMPQGAVSTRLYL
jgi:hypothetical protein